MNRFKNIFFGCLFVSCVLFTAGSSAKSLVEEETGHRHALYQRALYEAAESMNSCQISLKKMTVTKSKAMETEYLSKISGYAASVQNSLATLPVKLDKVNETIKFVNQTGDFALSLLKKLSKGGAVSDADRETILVLTETSTKLCRKIEQLANDFSEGKVAISESGYAGQGEITNLVHPNEEYPTLLYDGPFSDSLLNRKMKGLGNTEVTMEEAKENLKRFLNLSDNDEIRFSQETGGEERTYVFNLPGRNAQASVTKRGGKVLYVLSDAYKGEEALEEETCISIAKEFLLKKGFGSMHASYYRKFDGAITINLAPVQNGVILYPDLIKMEIDMANGNIAGMEFTDYYMNHTQRSLEFEIPAYDDGSEYADLQLVSKRPALIPVDGKEKLTIEYHLKDENNEYLVYKDVSTGDEIVLYEVVHLADGTIVQ